MRKVTFEPPGGQLGCGDVPTLGRVPYLAEWELLFLLGDRFLAWVKPITHPPGNYQAGCLMNLFDGGHEFSSEMA